MIVVLAGLLSGVMFYLSQGLDNAWYLAWFAPVPLLWLAYSKAPVWQVALASLAAVLAEAIYALQCYYGMIPPLIFLQVIGPAVVLFPLAIVFARFAQRRSTPLIALFAFPACWTAFEFLSEFFAPNGTYGSFAYSQVSSPLLIQSASLFGLYVVTFLICLFANTLAIALRGKPENTVAIALGFAICAANVVFGFARLAEAQAQTVRVAAMVDETATMNSWDARTLPEMVAAADSYADAIRRAAKEGVRFAVMPEGGIVAAARLRPRILAPLFAAAKQTKTQIVVGVAQNEPVGDLAFSMLPDGSTQQYTKRHLVPILEGRLTPGHGSGWLGQGRAVEICKDMDFPRTIRRDALKGVRLMGVPAGDFGKDAWLHARMAVMRGVENGFALVRAATDGLVTASDAEGRLVAAQTDSPKGLTLIVASLPIGPGPTLYTRIGNVFPWFCVVLLCLIGISSLVPKKLNARSVRHLEGSVAGPAVAIDGKIRS